MQKGMKKLATNMYECITLFGFYVKLILNSSEEFFFVSVSKTSL